jgi:hypothetical protein
LRVHDEDDLPQTIDPWCPACASERIERIGLEHSINFGPFRALHRCCECEGVFLFVRPRSRWTPAPVTHDRREALEHAPFASPVGALRAAARVERRRRS